MRTGCKHLSIMQLLAALPLPLLLLLPADSSAAAPGCCNASAFRENVILGGEDVGSITKTRTALDCCDRCQSDAACGCCECAMLSVSQ